MRQTAFFVIDVQKGLDDSSWGKRNNPNAESNIALLLTKWHKSGVGRRWISSLNLIYQHLTH
jgi:nicotinamidase-related amidase